MNSKKSNIKTIYVIPKFNSEKGVILKDKHASFTAKNIIVESSLPQRRKHIYSSLSLAPNSSNDRHESISLVNDSSMLSTSTDAIDLEDNGIFISCDPIKHEELLEINMPHDEDYVNNDSPSMSTFHDKNMVKCLTNTIHAEPSKIYRTKEKNLNLEKALNDIYEKNFSPIRAAHINGIKLSILENHLHGQQHRNKSLIGADPTLSAAEEISLVDWIKSRYRSGFPVKKIDLINKVANMVVGRQTRFKDGIPGEKWFLNFMSRHSNVSALGPSARADSRQIPSKRSINSWFKSCQEHIHACGNSELFTKSSNIGTAEEIVLNLNPTLNESDTEVDIVSKDEECGNIIILIGACADGEFMPPMPVFSCRKPSPNLVESVPFGWGIGLSKEGKVDKNLMYNYLKNILIPWLNSHDKLPFILFIDKLKSYLSVETADYCAQKGLIIYNFYPNSNYVLEPLYNCIIDGIKTAYNSLKHYDSEKQALLNACPNLEKIIKTIATPSVIKESFKLCGIFPFDPNAADCKKCLLGMAQREAKNFTLSEYNQSLEVIETLIGQEKLATFFNVSKDNIEKLSIEDRSLFKLWKKISSRTDIDKRQNDEFSEYWHEKILREGLRKLPRPDTYLKVTDDDDPISLSNFTNNILPVIEPISTDEYGSKLLGGVELMEVGDEISQEKEIKDQDGTSKCNSAMLWKQYYGKCLRNRKRNNSFMENGPYTKKFNSQKDKYNSKTLTDHCSQCLKHTGKLILCRVCRKAIHFECMEENEKEIVDHLRKGVLDFEYVCLYCS